MKQRPGFSLCGHSAKRIKNLLNKDNYQLLVHPLYEVTKKNAFLITHKCDYIRLPQVLSHIDKVSLQESETECEAGHETAGHETKYSNRCINPTSCSGFPLTTMDEEAAATQCCISQKYVRHYFFPVDAKKPHEALTSRNIRSRFKEYLLASKQLKHLTTHAIPNAKRYQIAVLKEEEEEKWPTTWLTVKMEERTFLMGHTIKHP